VPSCAVCRKRRAVHRHHLVKQQKIRARWRTLRYRAGGKPPYKLTTVLNDPRLVIDVCGFDGCHVEEAPVPIPDGFWDAVAEYGLAPDLPRWLSETYIERLNATATGPEVGIKEKATGGRLADATESDRQAARDGYNPNW
jgi:hypothetical protein